jgi:biopolymer transport protein TolR
VLQVCPEGPLNQVAASFAVQGRKRVGGILQRSIGVYAGEGDMQAGKSEINVTPLIDVLLVLLIIFMVITPLMPRGLAANVPAKSADNSPSETPIVLQIFRNGQLSINSTPVSSETFAATIRTLYSSRANKVLFVAADKDLEYRQVAQLIDRVKGASPDIQVGLMP